MEHDEHQHEHDSTDVTATFPTDTAGLPHAVPTQVVELATATPSSFESRRSRHGSATTPCG